MSQVNSKKESIPTQVRLSVEVDGHPVGSLNLDLDRIWPLINHRKDESVPVEWMDAPTFHSIMRAVVQKRLVSRIQSRLHPALGDEMVKAELDAEEFKLKADAAAQIFGRTKSDIEKFVADSGRTPADFYALFWEYLLEDRDVSDLKKDWKAKDTPPR